MKKRSNKRQRTLVDVLGESRIAALLFEQEDEEGGDEDTDEEGGDEEGSDEEGGDEEDADADAEERPIETSTEDEIRLQDKLDSELEAVFGDFETRARKSAALTKESARRMTLAGILFETETPETQEDFDLDQFAADTARLINNYSTLLDMEAIIYNKAKQFLTDKYGIEVASELRNILVDRHGVDFMEEEPGLDEPIAVVGQGGGGGGV